MSVTLSEVEPRSIDEESERDEEVDQKADDATLAVLQNNGKHASLAVLSVLMESILTGRDAERLLAESSVVEDGGLWVAPRFGWKFSVINVGRKELGVDGERLQMPVHLEWSEPLKVLASGEEFEATWLTSSMGHVDHGSTRVVTSERAYETELVNDDSQVPVSAVVPFETAREIRVRLNELVEQGRHAMWELKMTWEPRVRSMVYRAHASSCIEISEFTGADLKLLDDTAIDAVVDEFMYGSDDDDGKMHRIIEKVLLPQSMQKVDPLRYMNAAVRRDTAEAVRRRIGDNRTGRRIRAVAKTLDSPDVDAVIAAVREAYPRDKIAEKRVIAALTITPDPMAGRWSNHHEDGSERLFADPDSLRF